MHSVLRVARAILSVGFLVGSILGSLMLSISPAYAGVQIFKSFATDILKQKFEVGAGDYKVISLPAAEPGDVFYVQVTLTSNIFKDVSAFIIDESGYDRLKKKQPYEMQGKLKGVAPFNFQATISSTGKYYLVLDNSYATFIKKQPTVEVKKLTTLPEHGVDKLQSTLQTGYAGFKAMFGLPREYNIRVQPCGQEAAPTVGAGEIVLCTETIGRMYDKPGATLGTLFHALAHALTKSWPLANGEKEEVADEFAAVMLLQLAEGARLVDEWATGYENRDFANIDKHALAAPRLATVHGYAAKPADLIQLWSKDLYPRMKDDALQRIITAPAPYDDVELAKAEYEKRHPAPPGKKVKGKK